MSDAVVMHSIGNLGKIELIIDKELLYFLNFMFKVEMFNCNPSF